MDQQTATALAASALTNPVVAALYAAVDARSPITIVPSDEDTWGSLTDASSTKISVAATNHPAESLYHELLHANLKLSGYRPHTTYARIIDNPSLRDLANAIDNELQHHRIFPNYVAAGFAPEHFYHDGDNRTFTSIRAGLKRLKPAGTSAAEYFLMYLSIIAPGGSGGGDERGKLDRFFRQKVPQDKLRLVNQAAAKVQSWGPATSDDPGPLTVDIITGLGEFDGWWIGASKDFPADGHFIGAPFSADDAQRYNATHP
jgi:hypothetical protein